jgi:hypothetical protein
MSRVHRLSEQMIDYGERLSKMADAAEGKTRQPSRIGRWMFLPAMGAGVYALVRSEFFTRQAKEVVDEAKSRAADLPDDLMTRVHQATNGTATRKQSSRSATGSTGSRQRGASRKKTKSSSR